MGEVMTAINDELKTWIDHDCFQRHPRRNAVNILDVKWVLKWKWIPRKGKNGELNWIRIIRARLTRRGFKDLDKCNLQTFSGTASRLAQKLMVSEICVHQDQHWELWTVDVKRLFSRALHIQN